MRTVLCGLLLIAVPFCRAHVGNPDVYVEGDAGPYHLLVTIRMPPAVPGVAELEIRSGSPGVSEIQFVPLRLTGAGSQMGPAPDSAAQSTLDPRLFTGHLWIMEFHALQVHILVNGSRGRGEMAVPLIAEVQRTLKMQKGLGAFLLTLVFLLLVGCVSIVRAAAGEARLRPGQELTRDDDLRLRRAGLIAAFVAAGIIVGGYLWWSAQARAYADVVFTSPPLTASIQPDGRLVLHPPQGKWSTLQWSDLTRPDELIPDHGYLMHLFLVRMPEMDRFLHLHPQSDDSGFFSQNLPNLPAGHYRAFADVVTRTGWPLTMLGDLSIPEIHGHPVEGDDSGAEAPAISSSAPNQVSVLPDQARIILMDELSFRSRTATRIRFRIEEPGGSPAKDMGLYMGMAGHMIVVSSDGSIFAHVHPYGSPAMATLEMAQATLPSLKIREYSHGMVADSGLSELSFPYGFPKAGAYRLFVQIRKAGRVETGVFDVRVVP